MTATLPGFTADVLFGRSGAVYQATSAMVDRRAGLIHPAFRSYCSMKGCCIDLSDEFGIPRICCNGDECGPDVFI